LLNLCYYEGSDKLEWIEIKWYTQRLVYAETVNVLGGSVHTIKKNTEDCVVTSKETGKEINADKIKYMIISR